MSKSSGTDHHTMNIAFFNTNKAWGGGEKWHLDTAMGLNSRKHKVILFACEDQELFQRAKLAGLTVFGFRVSNFSFLNPVKIIRLAALLKRLRVEAIILNLSSDVKFAGIAAKAAGIKKIIYRRGLPVPVVNNIMNRFIFRRVLTHVIANSRAIKARILQNNSTLIPENKITVIYNGVDAPVDDTPNDPIPLFSQARGVLIGSAGRLSKEKRQEALIDMAGILHRKNLEFSLFIAGEGNMLDSLNRKVMQQGLGKVVILPGFISDIDMFYRAIDIFILASKWEGCSNAVLEAMQHGLPVIAFDNSSFRELVEHENTGFLARDGDVADLAEKAEILIREPEMRKRFGAAARNLISIKFSKEKSLDLLENLLCS